MDNLEFESKPATLGVSLNTPTQKHGDERVPAKGVRVKGMLLDKAEWLSLAERIGVPHHKQAWDLLFNERKGKPAEPVWGGAVAHTIPGKFKNSAGKITFGVQAWVVTFNGATVSRIQFEEQLGGMIAISFNLLALKSNIRGELARLDEFLGHNVSCALTLGDPDDEDEEGEDDEDQESLNLTPGGTTKPNGDEPDKNARRRKPSDGPTVN